MNGHSERKHAPMDDADAAALPEVRELSAEHRLELLGFDQWFERCELRRQEAASWGKLAQAVRSVADTLDELAALAHRRTHGAEAVDTAPGTQHERGGR